MLQRIARLLPLTAGVGYTRDFSMQRFGLAALIVLCFLLAVGYAYVIYPVDDEAYYASPAANLVLHGHFGTTTYEGPGLPNLDKRSYWMGMFQPALLIGWFQLFGVGLISQRMMSALFAVLTVYSWHRIVWKLNGNSFAALLAAGLVAIETTLYSGVNGRPDLVGYALGVGGIAGFLTFRDTRFPLACALGYAGAAMAGLSHPVAGVLAFTNITLVILMLDRRRIGWKAVAASAAPFLFGAAVLAFFIHPHWAEAWTQFGTNMRFGSRMDGWANPFPAWIRVAGYILEGYWGPGLASRVKILIPLTYVLAIGLAFWKSRQTPGVAVLATIAVADCLILPLMAGFQKWQYYLYIMMMFPPVVAMVFASLWRQRQRNSFLAFAFAGLLAASGLLQGARMAHTFQINPLGTRFAPSAARLQQPPFDKGSFWGEAFWAYAVGLDRLVEDPHMGYYTGKRKDFVIVTLDEAPPGYGVDGPPKTPIEAHIRTMLANEYELVLDDKVIHVYRLRSRQAAN